MQLVRSMKFNTTKLVNIGTVLSEYLYAAGGHTPTAWQEKGVAVAGMTAVALGKVIPSGIPSYLMICLSGCIPYEILTLATKHDRHGQGDYLDFVSARSFLEHLVYMLTGFCGYAASALLALLC